MGGKPKLKDRILHNEKWYIYKYVVALRHVEYYMNCAGGQKKSFIPYLVVQIQASTAACAAARRAIGTRKGEQLT